METQFPNAQLSPPIPGNESLRFLSFRAPALGGRGDVLLFMPPSFETLVCIPIVLLLHGVYGCQWNWWLNGSIDTTALAMLEHRTMAPMLIAMPSDGLWGDGSGYVPHAHADYERWIIDDIPACLRELFPQLERNKLFLAGLSMGGFGALRIGMKYSERVAGISAHSSVTDVKQLPQFIPYQAADFQYAGLMETDLLHWAKAHRASLPPLRFDCGTEDSLIEANRELHRALLDLGIPHQFEEFPGAHDWPYWSAQVRSTLSFFSKIIQR